MYFNLECHSYFIICRYISLCYIYKYNISIIRYKILYNFIIHEYIITDHK